VNACRVRFDERRRGAGRGDGVFGFVGRVGERRQRQNGGREGRHEETHEATPVVFPSSP